MRNETQSSQRALSMVKIKEMDQGQVRGRGQETTSCGPLRAALTLSQVGFDPPKQREDCYRSTTLPPSHHAG